MSRLRDLTESSRLNEVAEKIERGEDVDWNRVHTLQSLDIARAGRAALLDALDREDEADEQLRELLD